MSHAQAQDSVSSTTEEQNKPTQSRREVSAASLKVNSSWQSAPGSSLQGFVCFVTFVDLRTMRAMEKLGGVGKLEEAQVLCQEPPTSHSCSVWGSALGREGSCLSLGWEGKFRSCKSQAGISLLGELEEETEGVWAAPCSTKADVMHFPVYQHW